MAKFANNVLISMAGVVTASVVSLALLPLVTRAYLPESIGVWQVLLTAALVVVPLATLRYESAIVLERDEKISNGLLASSGFMTLLMVLLCLSLISFFAKELLSYFQLTNAYHIYILPFVVVMLSGFYMFSGSLIKHERFTVIAILKVFSAFVLPITALGFAWLDEASTRNYLVAGCALFLFQMLTTAYFARKWSGWKCCLSGLKYMGTAARKYSDYPKYMVPYAMTSSLILQVTAAGMLYLYTPAVVGAYFVAQQVVNVPVTVIAAGLRNVVFSFSAKNIGDRPDFVANLIEKLALYIMVLVIPLSCLAFFFSKAVLVWFLGDGWIQAAAFSTWMIISSTSNILTSWLDRQFEVVGKQKLSVLLEVLFNVGILALFYLAYEFEYTAIQLVVNLSIYTAIFNMYWMFVLYKNIGIAMIRYVKYLAVVISMISVFLLVAYYIYTLFSQSHYVLTGCLLAVFSIMYLGLIFYVYTGYKRALVS